jgi:hypothetical protein
MYRKMRALRGTPCTPRVGPGSDRAFFFARMHPVLFIIQNIIEYVNTTAEHAEQQEGNDTLYDACAIEKMPAEYQPGKYEYVLYPLARPQ